MAKGKRTGGRVKGVPNKLTTGAKEVIAQVAANIGGGRTSASQPV